MSVSLKPVESLSIGLLGLGAEGGHIVSGLRLPKGGSVECGVWDSCAMTLESRESSSRPSRLLGLQVTHGLGCVGQTDLGRSVFLGEQDFCRSWLEGKDLVILVGALGGGFAGGCMPELARLAGNMEIPCLAYCLTPFSFEGRKRMESSRAALNRLRELCLAAPTFDGDDYLSWIDDNGDARAAVGQCRLQCAGAVEGLIRLMLEDGIYEFNLLTLQSAFDLDSAKTLVMSGSGTNTDDVEQALEDVLARIDEKLSGRETKVDRLLIAVIGGRTLSVENVNRVNRIVSERFDKPGKTFWGACIDPELVGIRIVVYLSIHLGKQFELVNLPDTKPLKEENEANRKRSGKKSKTQAKRKKTKPDEADSQEYFDAILNDSNRGYFDDTPANNWNGVDLDIPTYIRRGIRVKS